MRVFKFRAWDITAKKMYDLNEFPDYYYYLPRGDTPYTKFMQYVGLKDKNGKEIFEGDIVQGKIGEVHNGHLIVHIEEQGEIKFVDGGFELELYPIGCFDELEVVGNIYENPELLNKED